VHEHRGLSIAIAMIAVAFLATLPFALTILIWLSLCIYSLVKMIGAGDDHAVALTVLLQVVLLVGFLALAYAGTIALIGRSMSPRRRRSEPGWDQPVDSRD
jgi:hypothetical protein